MTLLDNTLFEDRPPNAGAEILAHMLAEKYITYYRTRKCVICEREDPEVHHFLLTRHDRRKDVGRILRVDEFKYSIPYQIVTIKTPKPIAACVYCSIGRRATDTISRLPKLPSADRQLGLEWQRASSGAQAPQSDVAARKPKSKPTLADL